MDLKHPGGSNFLNCFGLISQCIESMLQLFPLHGQNIEKPLYWKDTRFFVEQGRVRDQSSIVKVYYGK